MLESEGAKIDCSHLDADCSFEQGYKDFTNYASLLSPTGIVSFHDTCRNAPRLCNTGVPKTLREILKEPNSHGLQILDAHHLCRGVAIAIPKKLLLLRLPKEPDGTFVTTMLRVYFDQSNISTETNNSPRSENFTTAKDISTSSFWENRVRQAFAGHSARRTPVCDASRV